MSPEVLAQRLASLQQWMGRGITEISPDVASSGYALAFMPRVIADATVVIDPLNTKAYPSTNCNHVEHFGTSGLAAKRILAEIIELYRCASVSRFFVYVSPEASKRQTSKNGF